MGGHVANYKGSVIERILKQTAKENDCLVFSGARNGWNYGIISNEGKCVIVSRFVYWFYKKQKEMTWEEFVKTGIQVLHKCDNPPCCNIEHLFGGTNKDNVNDKMKKGRHKTKLNQEQILQIRTSEGFQRNIAKKFSISQGHVSRIKNNVEWKI